MYVSMCVYATCVWVLGTRLRSRERAAGTPNC